MRILGTIALGFLSANLPLLAFEGQPSASDGDLQEDRRRLVIMTQELLKAAKERLEDQRQQVAQQRRKQVVEQAQRLAVRLAKEKAQQQEVKDRSKTTSEGIVKIPLFRLSPTTVVL